MKGVELGTLNRMSEVIAEVTDAGPERIAVISGPNLAKEIARREPAASVVACADEEVAKMLQDRCHSPAFRPYTSVDVLGCELGGAYKNVVGLAVGMAVGLGFGDNTTASVITRGLAETARLATKLGANPLTLMGLAGLGDLVATCSSPLSRNRTFGEKLGQGMTHRGDHRLHPPGRRGRQVLRLAARARRADRRRRPGRAVRRRRRRRPDDGRGDDGRDPGPRDEGGDRSSYRSSVERLAEVGPEVLDVLDADRAADQPVGDGRGLGLPAAAALERRLDAAEAGGVHPERGGTHQQVRLRRRWAARSRPSPPRPG